MRCGACKATVRAASPDKILHFHSHSMISWLRNLLSTLIFMGTRSRMSVGMYDKLFGTAEFEWRVAGSKNGLSRRVPLRKFALTATNSDRRPALYLDSRINP